MKEEKLKRLRVYQAVYILHGTKVNRKGAFRSYGEAIKYFSAVGAKIVKLYFVGWEKGWTLINEE